MFINKSIKELRKGIKQKDFSKKEIADFYLSRIKKFNNLNAFSHIHPINEKDLNNSDISSDTLSGIPVALKDNILSRNNPATACSKILDGFIAPYDATVTSKLKSSGAILIGNNNMDEFAMGSSSENSSLGNVLNPWDLNKVPGGSSGGGAAAVAARLIPVALGTDTGGSVRQPASFCGIVGLKPTYGRNSRYGVIAYASSLDQVGVMTNSVEDCALVSEIIAGFDPLDSTSVDVPIPNFSSTLGKDIKGLRIGIPKEYFIKELNTEIDTSIRTALSELEKLGATLVEISLPHTEYAVATYYIIAPAEAASNLSRYDGIRYGKRSKDTEDLFDLYCKTRTEGFGTEVKRRILIGTYVLSEGYFDAYYIKAQKVRTLVANDFKEVFENQCDIIACPTAPTTAFNLGEKCNDPISMYLNDIFTIPTNLAGLPAMSIPCGFDSNNMPIGLQLIGKAWDEETIFKTAYLYEQTHDWHKRIPKGFE